TEPRLPGARAPLRGRPTRARREFFGARSGDAPARASCPWPGAGGRDDRAPVTLRPMAQGQVDSGRETRQRLPRQRGAVRGRSLAKATVLVQLNQPHDRVRDVATWRGCHCLEIVKRVEQRAFRIGEPATRGQRRTEQALRPTNTPVVLIERATAARDEAGRKRSNP